MKWVSKVSPLIRELELRKSPVIIRVNKFDEDSASAFQNEIARAHSTGQEVIPVVISSYGGQVYSLMTMISAIRHSELPVATIVEGKAMSCGAILFSFGADGMRYMDPDATVMIHDVSSMSFGKNEETKASAEESDRLNQKIFEMMATNCGKKKSHFLDEVHERGHADWFLTAEDSKKHGLTNHLHVPTMTINVDVTIDFE
jgi:ATP-dependent Clp protease protease subunit